MTLLLLSAAAATLLLGAAALLSLITRRASLRHAAWTVALAASLVLPAWLNWAPPASHATGALVRTAGISLTVTAAPSSDWLPALYLLGVAAVLTRHAASLYQLRRLRLSARLLEPGVYESPAVAIPLTYGLMNPVILVPENGATPYVLAHERAHLDRGDLWANAIATLATAAYWFHPAVWYAAARLRREAEFAVDDRIVTATPDPAAYAQELLTVARRASRTPVAAISMASPGQLEGRLLAILDVRRNRRPITRAAWTLLALAVVSLSVPLGTLAQQAPPQRIRLPKPPEIVKKVQPVYPESMKKQGIQGAVVLNTRIDKEGRVQEVEVVSSPHKDLTASALTAVSKWIYRPTLLNGNPVAVETPVTVTFTLAP